MTHIEDDWARWRQETPFDKWFDAKGYDQDVDAHRGQLRAAWLAAVAECCEQARDEVQSILDWDKADQVVARIKEHFGVTE
jgi:hypothetical protein